MAYSDSNTAQQTKSGHRRWGWSRSKIRSNQLCDPKKIRFKPTNLYCASDLRYAELIADLLTSSYSFLQAKEQGIKHSSLDVLDCYCAFSAALLFSSLHRGQVQPDPLLDWRKVKVAPVFDNLGDMHNLSRRPTFGDDDLLQAQLYRLLIQQSLQSQEHFHNPTWDCNLFSNLAGCLSHLEFKPKDNQAPFTFGAKKDSVDVPQPPQTDLWFRWKIRASRFPSQQDWERTNK